MALIRTGGGAGAKTFSETGTLSYGVMTIDVQDYSTLNMTISNDDNYQNTVVALDGTTIGTASKDSPGLTLTDYDISGGSTLTITATVNTTVYGMSRTYTLSLA